MSRLIRSDERMLFLGIPDGARWLFHRLTGLAELEIRANPEYYTRRYFDEEQSRSDVTGYRPEIKFIIDRIADDPAHEELTRLQTERANGGDAVRPVLLAEPEGGKLSAVLQDYAVLVRKSGGNETITLDCLCLACGKAQSGTAAVGSDGMTALFLEEVDRR